MIVPSIDLMNGNAVQLIGGEKMEIDAGDPMPIADRFKVAGELAVIDLDAALGTGNNREVIERLLRKYPCRVGGGIRDYETALELLDQGARKVIIGTAANRDLLSRLPRDRVIAALDARNGEVVVEGWKTPTGRALMERISGIKDLVGGFLITFVEREGRMGGMDMEMVKAVVEAAGDVRVTVAGGVATADEVGEIDRLGADVQVGMSLYSGKMDLADAITAPMVSDREDGLWPTVVADEYGLVLGLAWSDAQSVREALRTTRGVYRSRKRGLWRKGESSGDVQELLKIDVDCDRDTLRFTVRQRGRGFCHQGTMSCFGDDFGVGTLFRLIKSRMDNAPDGSYTKRLFDEPGLVQAKLVEEAGELAEARGEGELIHEAADVIYFTLATLARGGVSLTSVEQELERRNLKLIRRPGDAKVSLEEYK